MSFVAETNRSAVALNTRGYVTGAVIRAVATAASVGPVGCPGGADRPFHWSDSCRRLCPVPEVLLGILRAEEE